MTDHTGRPAAWSAPPPCTGGPRIDNLTMGSSLYARLNRRKRKKLGVGEFARTAVSVRLALDPILDAPAIAAVRRTILDSIGELRLVAAGVFHQHGAELVIQPRHAAVDARALSTIQDTVRAAQGVIAIEVTLHGDAWVDEAGRRHRACGTYLIPRVRDLLRRSLSSHRNLRETTLIVPKG